MSFNIYRRGGFAPRGGRDRWNGPMRNPKSDLRPDIQKNPLVKSDNEFSESLISSCHYVASYNWLAGEESTIVVPGKPPQWTPLPSLQALSEDSGQYFRDPNAARCPKYPSLPAVKAILHADPTFNTADIDLVTCGSTLGNLLRFVKGTDRAFRFDVEVIGDTIFFIRKENDPKELIEDVRGFGHTFPEANTTWEKEVKGSETHQRIVQYSLGHIKCLVRFECDGYIKDHATQVNETDEHKIGFNETSYARDEDALLDSLQSANVSQAAHELGLEDEKLMIRDGGAQVSQDAIFDLKTRSRRKGVDINMDDMYPSLWLKQIPIFIAAYHNGSGLFEDVRVQNVRKDVQKWEADNIDTIRRLIVLIERIIEMAKEDARGLLEVYFSGVGGLEIRQQWGDGAHALPEEMEQRWMSTCTDSDDASLTSSDGGCDLPNTTYLSSSDWKSYSDDGKNEDEDEELDYTACSADDCGYCGRCTY